MPSAIHGRAKDLNLSETAASVISDSRKSARLTAAAPSLPSSGREPIDRMVVEMAAVDAGIGDEEALRAEPKPDALGNAGKFCGQRRPCGAIEDPDRAETWRRKSAASRIRLRPRRSSDPPCSK